METNGSNPDLGGRAIHVKRFLDGADSPAGFLSVHGSALLRRSPKGFKGHVVQTAPQMSDLLASAGVTIVGPLDTYDSGEKVKT
jgi:hypothetical protein